MSQFISYPQMTYEIKKQFIKGTVYKHNIELQISDSNFKELGHEITKKYFEILNNTNLQTNSSNHLYTTNFKQLKILHDLQQISQNLNSHCLIAMTFEAAHIIEDLNIIPEDHVLFEFIICDCDEIKTSDYINSYNPVKKPLPELEIINNSSDEYFERYKNIVEHLKNGDIYEFVLSRKIEFKTNSQELFEYLKFPLLTQKANYRFALEFPNNKICGASPEILLEVENNRATMRPISGSVRRMTNTAILNAEEIKELNLLLSSEKEKCELDMLIDLARNDLNKFSTQVEVSRYRETLILEHIIHTQATVTGILKTEFKAIDATLLSLNAGTLVGVPKRKAMEIIYTQEQDKRSFYGGNLLHFKPNGNLSAIILIRSAFFNADKVTFQAGSSIVLEADPQYEYWECGAKLKNLISLIQKDILCFNDHKKPDIVINKKSIIKNGQKRNKKLLMIENFDSFSHNLISLFEKCGATVEIVKNNIANIDYASYDAIVLSPGPSHPKNAGYLIEHIKKLKDKKPIFGVCLGFQAIIEAFGSEVAKLDEPIHGKAKTCYVKNSKILFQSLPNHFLVGRYHSLFAYKVPENVNIVGYDEINTPLALELINKNNNICAVQFHPESFLTGQIGEKIITNWMESLS